MKSCRRSILAVSLAVQTARGMSNCVHSRLRVYIGQLLDITIGLVPKLEIIGAH